MSIKTVTHLNFRGEARAALEFYQSVFGGALSVVTHAMVYGTTDAAEADLIGWGQVVSEAGFAIMAYDVPARLAYGAGDAPFFVSVRGTEAEEITRHWARLKAGASVIQDLGPSGWAPIYGMLKDKFGVTWVLDMGPA